MHSRDCSNKLSESPGVVELLHADSSQQDNSVRIFFEKLTPVLDFTTKDELRDFMRGLLVALRWVHWHECVHGDIKQSNIMMSRSN
jgi:tRNA A-37 threonylcarbamoyl transferase component Bud32